MMLHAFKEKEDALRDAYIHCLDRVVYFASPGIVSRDREVIRTYDMDEMKEKLDFDCL